MSEFEEGDQVKILCLEESQEAFCVLNLVVGRVYEVVEVDEEDNSVKVGVRGGSYDWVYTREVNLVITAEDVEEKAQTTESTADFIITPDAVTLTLNDCTEVVTKDHKDFTTIRSMVIDGEYELAMQYMNVSESIAKWGQGALQIQDGVVKYSGMELTGKLVDRIIGMMKDGDEDFERFAKFLTLAMEQPSYKTRTRIMDFAAHDKLDIDEDGFVVAFKNVRDDYMDKHSGTFRNMVGDSPSMRRSDVNDDHDVTCSAGLHVCSPIYLKGFWGTSGITVRVVVDPRDFVAIPYDYKDSKARVCKYRVVEDVTDNIQDYL